MKEMCHTFVGINSDSQCLCHGSQPLLLQDLTRWAFVLMYLKHMHIVKKYICFKDQRLPFLPQCSFLTA